MRRAVVSAGARAFSRTTSSAKTTARHNAEAFVEDLVNSEASGLFVNAPVGNFLAAIGTAGFTLTYGYHIAKPVYDAYTQHDDDGDDDDEAGDGKPEETQGQKPDDADDD